MSNHRELQTDRRKRTREALGPERLQIDAFHEAGHVVMNWLLGLGFNLDFIDMYGTDEASAYVHYRRDECGVHMVETFRELPLGKHRATQEVMICMAGPAAEYKHMAFEGDWFLAIQQKHESETDDLGCATAVAKALHGNTEPASVDFLRTVSQWSYDVIGDPQIWPIVEQLAVHLVKSVGAEPYERTTASIAHKIIEVAAGRLVRNHPPIGSLGDQWKQRLSYKP